MASLPAAVGYLRKDISGTRQQWDETQMRSLAGRMGYDYRKTLVFGPDVDGKVHRLRVAVSRTGAAAVFVPSIDHFEGEVPGEVVAVADVVTVSPVSTYTRTATGLRAESGQS
ncbi:hypothetical protein [Nocardia sp. NBC_00511]|uniref:hypothetical protein n=1 Tax=Nocardia sp. NBC_00511 TaxID=2903591 RepID=UPI0030E3D61A